MDTREISVVVQGDVKKEYASACLNSIRKKMKHSEIILSTWENTDCTGLDYDKLVISPDPGACIQNLQSQIPNNLNRQLISTSAGIRAAAGKYILKIRADMVLKGTGFLKLFYQFPVRQERGRYFNKRILICNYYTRNPRVLPMPYHFSDWTAFGEKDDIRRYYEAELQSESEAYWFYGRNKDTALYKNFLGRYSAEQHITLYGASQALGISCENYYDNTEQNKIATEYYLANNFIVFDYGENTIRFLKYNPNRYGDRITLYSHRQWELLYQKYILKRRVTYLWKEYLLWCGCKRLLWTAMYGTGGFLLEQLRLKESLRMVIAKRR